MTSCSSLSLKKLPLNIFVSCRYLRVNTGPAEVPRGRYYPCLNKSSPPTRCLFIEMASKGKKEATS